MLKKENSKIDDVTDEERRDVKEFYIAKAKGETKKCSLEELLKELHE